MPNILNRTVTTVIREALPTLTTPLIINLAENKLTDDIESAIIGTITANQRKAGIKVSFKLADAEDSDDESCSSQESNNYDASDECSLTR